MTDLSQHTRTLSINTRPFNLSGHPAISVNAGFLQPQDGNLPLPVGMQIVGRKFDDITVLRVAKAVESLVKR